MSNMTRDPNAHMPIGNTQTAAQLAGGSTDGKVKDKTTTLTREITSLAQRAITVMTTNRAQAQQTTGASGTTGVPVLDDPEDPKALLQDLERLVAFLQLDNDQRQSELARKRIDSQQKVMDTEHQNRLEKTVVGLDIGAENLQASESRIRDTDMAKEMVDFTKNQVLQQAGTAMIAQANQQSQSVLSLLR